MSSWLSHLLATEIHIPWIAPALADMTNDHKLPDSLPSHSTKDGDSLPPPVLQTNNTRQMRRKSARFGAIAVYWAKFKRHLGTDTVPSSSSQVAESAVDNSYIQTAQEDGAIDEVVVDRVWSEEIKSVESHSDHGASPGESHQFNPGGSDRESLVYEGFWSMWPPLAIIRWRAWPLVMEIFSSRFVDERSEQHYAQESWFLKKSLALWASLWLIVNWVLGCIFIPHPVVFLDKIFYFAVAPVLSLPVVFMVMYDWPRDRAYIYQTFLIVSIWCWSFYQVIFIISCGYYSTHPNCQNRDFMATFYYATALQTIALFGLKLNRFPAALGALVFFLFASIALIPVRSSWARSMINFFIFHSILIYIHYMRESSERRLYTLRDQLKNQFKATQKAQINERKASDSKRRLTSYVFHEVRVPLNTALLAVQNMEASGTVAKDQEIEFNALCGSLSMMSKVLNDVLDFNRLDSGKFESVSKPYAFHQVMRSLFVPLRLATDARGLQLETDLDPNIDRVARQVAYEAIGESMESIRKHIEEHPDVDGMVTGDETRLRQIITNLASNACKFTPSGGKLTIKTRLIIPTLPTRIDNTADEVLSSEKRTDVEDHLQRPLSTSYLSQHDMQQDKPSSSPEWIAVRIEVTDTGYGINARDMAQSKLFSAFNQTEQGRLQGGKGTGLGLALVRQIVKLSGGRLGLQSKVGSGSTFWVELPLGVGRKTFINGGPDPPDTSSSSDLNTLNTRSGNVLTMPPLRDSVTSAMDGVALRAGQKSSTSTRTISVMQGIMEQGGRVELVLRKQGYVCPRNVSDPLPQLTQTLSCPDVPEPPPKPSQLPRESEIDLNNPAACHEPAASTSPKPTPVQRPTLVPLSRHQIFNLDDISQPPTTSTFTTDTGSPHLTVFDQFTHGSPSSSFVTNIEPPLAILVVDDDPLTRTLMKRILTRLGCVVSCAENGEVALEMILGHQVMVETTTPSSDGTGDNIPILERPQESPISDESKYAVVFLDNQMPVMSGLKVVERLRALSRTDFIVGVTGNALLSDQEEYLDAGVDRVLTKPVLERSLKDILIIADEKRKGRGEPLQSH